MDWITIVFIIIFFVLPVIQQILEAKRGKGGGAAEPEEYEVDWETTVPDRPIGDGSGNQEPRKPARSDRDPTWSDGWGEWPEPAEVGAPAERAPVSIAAEERMVQAPPMADPARDETYRRVQEALARKLAVEATRPPRAPHQATAAARVTPRTSRTRRGTGLALDDPEQLRKALILKEVLGPPLSLRSHEEDRASLH